MLSHEGKTGTGQSKGARKCGKVAVQRGPVVYCVEEADNYKGLHNIVVPRDVKFNEVYDEEFLNGVVVVNFKAYYLKIGIMTGYTVSMKTDINRWR